MSLKPSPITLSVMAATLVGRTIPGLTSPAATPPEQPGEPPVSELRVTFTADRMSLQLGR
ncbi:MAG TPA: hypothetical protein VJ714_00730 [Anaerolineae bacterium]|nr:hypothetical protein [Anaerolineae bacterium]